MNTLAAYLSKLKHSDFGPGGRLVPAVTPFDGGVGEFVNFGEEMIVDLYPNKLVRVRVQRRKTWQDGRLVNLKPVQILVEDCKKTYGDYVNGYWAVPAVFTLSEAVLKTLLILKPRELSVVQFTYQWFLYKRPIFTESCNGVTRNGIWSHEGTIQKCFRRWAGLWIGRAKGMGLVEIRASKCRLTQKAKKILEPLFL